MGCVTVCLWRVITLLDHLYKQPDGKIFELVDQLREPTMIYDLDGIKHTVRVLKEDIELIDNAFLHLAVKAIHNKEMLNHFAHLGLGCDVASVGEYRLVQDSGFRKITTTSPYYSRDSMRTFVENDIVMDLDSMDQLNDFVEMGYSKEVGLRIAIPIPEEMDTIATFGLDSRFGIDFYESKDELIRLKETYDLAISNLHIHTGQSTGASFQFKLKYLLEIASQIDTIKTINLGGGLFYLFHNREETRKLFKEMNLLIRNWENVHGRKLEFIFEPGGALLAGNGYLISEIVSKKVHKKRNVTMLQCDTSFWNLSPWIRSNPIFLNRSDEVERVVFVGNTLFEGDSLSDFKEYEVPKVKKGDKVLFPAFGAYALTNARRFNRLNLPNQYVLIDGEIHSLEEEIRGEPFHSI